MWAQSLLDFGFFTEGVFSIIRIIASIGGAVVGWFVCDPLTRMAYRLVYRAATPGSVLLAVKATGATLLSVLIYCFMPLGGSGGLGFGPGSGGGPGKGPGPGGDKGVQIAKDDKAFKDSKKIDPFKKPITAREPVEVEILGGKRFQDDGKNRYYLLKRMEPALSLAELEEFFKQNHAKTQVNVVLTEDSIGILMANGPLNQLRTLSAKYQIPMVEPKE